MTDGFLGTRMSHGQSSNLLDRYHTHHLVLRSSLSVLPLSQSSSTGENLSGSSDKVSLNGLKEAKCWRQRVSALRTSLSASKHWNRNLLSKVSGTQERPHLYIPHPGAGDPALGLVRQRYGKRTSVAPPSLQYLGWTLRSRRKQQAIQVSSLLL